MIKYTNFLANYMNLIPKLIYGLNCTSRFSFCYERKGWGGGGGGQRVNLVPSFSYEISVLN